MANRIRTNDEVVVIAGRDRGKRGRVIDVLPKKGRVVVEGVNVVVRHLKRNPQNPQAGGRVQRSAPIDISNVMLWSPEEQKGVRVGFEDRGSRKRRVARPSGKPLGGRRERGQDRKKQG